MDRSIMLRTLGWIRRGSVTGATLCQGTLRIDEVYVFLTSVTDDADHVFYI